MIKIWGNIIKQNKIVTSHMLTFEDNPCLDLYLNALETLCNELDLEMPIVLSKHKDDMNVFSLTRFYPSDFIEKVSFQRFEIEIFIEKDRDQ